MPPPRRGVHTIVFPSYVPMSVCSSGCPSSPFIVLVVSKQVLQLLGNDLKRAPYKNVGWACA